MTPSNRSPLSLWDLNPAADPRPPAPRGREGGAPDSGPQHAPPAADAGLASLFARVFRRLDIPRPAPAFDAVFRPFTGLRSSIRMRHGRVEVRVSDLLSEAPPLVLEALAEILLARLYYGRPSREARECYRAHLMSPETRQRLDETRRARGKKRLLPARGRYFDLQAIFDDLNARCFAGQLSRARIGWSRNRSRTVLGHYDAAHDAITISRWFDSRSVPGYVVQYLVYHEMLHICHPVERNGSRHVIHSTAFVAAEKRFPDYPRAVRHLRRLAGRVD